MVLVTLFAPSLPNAQAVNLTQCGAPGPTIRLDPVQNPAEHQNSGREISSEPIPNVSVTQEGLNGITVRWESWLPESESLTFYYIYISADGGATWRCYSTVGSVFTKGALTENKLHRVALIARSGDTWSPAFIKDIKLGPLQKEQVCPSNRLALLPMEWRIQKSAYNKILNMYSLSLTDKTLGDVEATRKAIEEDLVEREKYPTLYLKRDSLQYRFEYSIDNWRTKVIYREGTQTTFTAPKTISFKALSKKVPTKVRAIPDASQISPQVIFDPESMTTHPTPGYVEKPPTKGPGYTAEGCQIFEITVQPKETKGNLCLLDPNLPQCEPELVPAENFESGSTKQTSIKCQRDGVVRAIRAIQGKKTKCPAGFKKVS